jgi:integrase
VAGLRELAGGAGVVAVQVGDQAEQLGASRLATLTAREPVHVVSQRLGHASPVVTMTVYAHVLPGSQREAADLFARLVGEAKGA